MMNRRSFLQMAAAISAAVVAPLAITAPAVVPAMPKPQRYTKTYITMVRLCAWGKSEGQVRPCTISVNSRDHGVLMSQLGVSSHGFADWAFPFDSQPVFGGDDEPVVTCDSDGIQYGYILRDQDGKYTAVTGPGR